MNLSAEWRLTRRKSFAAWKQEVRGRSLAWGQEEVDSALALCTMLDIEQLRIVEDALQQSESLLADVVDSLNAQVAVLDHHGMIVATNRAWRSFATSPSGTSCLVGTNYVEACGSSVSSPYAQESGKALQGVREVLEGKRSAFEMQYPSAATDARWFMLRVFPLTGERKGALVSHEDISVATAAAHTVQRERQRYLTLMSIAQDGIHLLDEKGKLIEANAAFLALLGYTADDLGKVFFADWNAALPPAQVSGLVSALIDHPGLFQTKYRRRDGSVIEVEINAGGVELEGRRALPVGRNPKHFAAKRARAAAGGAPRAAG